MVKWFGPKTAFDAIHQCLLTFGHYGWSMDLPHQQRLRDVMGLEIGDGTAQVMKLIVARERVGRLAVQYAKRRRHEGQGASCGWPQGRCSATAQGWSEATEDAVLAIPHGRVCEVVR